MGFKPCRYPWSWDVIRARLTLAIPRVLVG